MRWCVSIEALSGKLIELLDTGGGWFPEDLQKDSAGNFRRAIDLIPDFLPHVRQIISEPGDSAIGLGLVLLGWPVYHFFLKPRTGVASAHH